MEFWIPKGANRFHFVGGARFVHGGAMPQEIVVPVITVRHVKGKSAQETKTKPVTVQVLGASHKITTPRHRFQLIQMEPVSERVKPVTLKVAVYEGDEPVTNIETVTFDSTSGKHGRAEEVGEPGACRTGSTTRRRPTGSCCGTPRPASSSRAWRSMIDRAFTDDF